MKHYSGIDYEHFLDDIRDMYPFSVGEAVFVELIANALDAKTSLIDIHIDPEQKIFELTDNGSGMDAKGFTLYHNFSTSFKRKGQGIGFAGLGAKLALKIADRIVTETRQGDSQKKGPKRSKNFWSTSEWKFERKGKIHQPVWYDLDERMLIHPGTRVRIYLKNQSYGLLQPEEIRRMILTHYLPLLRMHEFYESIKLYHHIQFLINGELLETPSEVPEKFKNFILHRGRSRKPFALARFELHSVPLAEDRQGIAISTYGKIITREWFKQYFNGMERITGMVEVPELVDCLTTNKCDFRKDGTPGRKYYRFTKITQQEFRHWLEEIQFIERKESSTDKTVQRLERIINRIVGEIPDLQQFYGFQSSRETLVENAGGQYPADKPESGVSSPAETQGERKVEELIKEALEKAAREGETLEPGGELTAVKKNRSVRFGPVIHYIEAPGRGDISWMEGDTVLINTAHPTYQKAVEKKVQEYHNLFAVALAMLREVPTAREKLELLEKFMSEWGKI